MHGSVRGTLSESRKNAVDRKNKRSGVLSCDWIIRDYVFVARIRGRWTKISANVAGTRKIAQPLPDYISSVQQLITQENEDINVSRINCYADALVGVSVQQKEIAE